MLRYFSLCLLLYAIFFPSKLLAGMDAIQADKEWIDCSQKKTIAINTKAKKRDLSRLIFFRPFNNQFFDTSAEVITADDSFEMNETRIKIDNCSVKYIDVKPGEYYFYFEDTSGTLIRKGKDIAIHQIENNNTYFFQINPSGSRFNGEQTGLTILEMLIAGTFGISPKLSDDPSGGKFRIESIEVAKASKLMKKMRYNLISKQDYKVEEQEPITSDNRPKAPIKLKNEEPKKIIEYQSDDKEEAKKKADEELALQEAARRREQSQVPIPGNIIKSCDDIVKGSWLLLGKTDRTRREVKLYNASNADEKNKVKGRLGIELRRQPEKSGIVTGLYKPIRWACNINDREALKFITKDVYLTWEVALIFKLSDDKRYFENDTYYLRRQN